MAGKYLGDTFDIHGGGVDLVFPHHENERAQTVCALSAKAAGSRSGAKEMALYWMHVGLLTTGGTKMSKSLGNSFLVSDALETVRPQALRFHLLSAHYRSPLEYGAVTLAEASAAYDRVETFVRNALDILGGPAAATLAAEEVTARSGWHDGPSSPAAESAQAAWVEFSAALDDDLGVARALAAVFGAVGRGNQVLSKKHKWELAAWVDVVRRMLTILGLDPVEQWPAAGGKVRPALDGVMEIVLDLRSAARARRDYAEADGIRTRLAAAGIVVEDTPEGQRWHLT